MLKRHRPILRENQTELRLLRRYRVHPGLICPQTAKEDLLWLNIQLRMENGRI